ncbi:hypothetical protein QBC40DRAFT_350574 [Triangularia verruculosa]|uniref:Uncharacterized protein n=1 Tax=Triangularia verruculosa TaxID=2587418 RepID=A0AAN7ASR3_9PEZI|nr:hypothetical protein QBC40DRAFT_350574 [Triangularia verruculosa]
MANGTGDVNRPDGAGKKSSSSSSRSSSLRSDRSSVAAKAGSITSVEEQDASPKKTVKFQEPVKDDTDRPVVESKKPTPKPRPYHLLSTAHQDQISSEQALNRLFTLALPDWDPLRHWTSDNRIYNGHADFFGNQQDFTTFTYTATNSIDIGHLLDTLGVSKFSPQREKIMSSSRGDKKQDICGKPVTFHVQVETFERTFEKGDFRVNWLSQGQRGLMERYAWGGGEKEGGGEGKGKGKEKGKGKGKGEKDEGKEEEGEKEEEIEHVYIFVPGEGPMLRQSPVYIDPWNWDRFRKSLTELGQDYKVFDGRLLFEGELVKQSDGKEVLPE